MNVSSLMAVPDSRLLKNEPKLHNNTLMIRSHNPFKSPLLIISALLAGSCLGDVMYSITAIGPGYAYGINSSGQVVGYTSQGAFLYSNGEMKILSSSIGGSFSAAMAINNSNQIVGYYSPSAGTHAFLLAGEVRNDLGVLDGMGIYSEAYGINDQGHVVGRFFKTDPYLYDAFLITDGVMVQLPGL